MIVLDNSVFFPTIVATAVTDLAMRAIAVEPDWILPPLWQYEFTSATTTLVRGKVVSDQAGRHAIDSARVAVGNKVIPVDQVRVMQLAVSLRISAYDAQYIALANAYNIICVTADRELASRAAEFAVLLDDFVNLSHLK